MEPLNTESFNTLVERAGLNLTPEDAERLADPEIFGLQSVCRRVVWCRTFVRTSTLHQGAAVADAFPVLCDGGLDSAVDFGVFCVGCATAIRTRATWILHVVYLRWVSVRRS